MTEAKNANLIKVKTELADKYTRLAASAKSDPKRRSFSFRAVKLRRQVQQLSRD